MSRCFPFPPPGYEKKHRPAEDLLREEKHREKKHKKEKKEKEKREGKDKKEKDKSDGKHKEKKDRKEKDRDKKEKDRDKKEKHRDKKKDKEKDRSKDKEKSSISEDTSIAGQPETRRVEKVHTREEGFKDKSNSSDEKNFTLQARGQSGQNLVDNRLFARENEESKFVQELGRRIRDEGKAMGSQPVGRISGADCKVQEETGKFAVRNLPDLAEDRERNREGRVDNTKLGGQGLRVGARFSGMVQNLAAVAEPKLEGISAPVQQKDIERSIEGREKSTDRDDDRSRQKRKKDKDKKSHGKDKGREKEKNKEEKAKEKTKNKKSDLERSKELYRNQVTDLNNGPYLFADASKNLTTMEIPKKRKDVETNGFLHENEVRPNKLPRLTSQNGRILEASQTSIPDAAGKQGVASNFRVDHKEFRVNGSIEAPSLFASKQKSYSATRSDQPAELIPRPPSPPLPSQTDPDEASKKVPLANQVAEASKNHCQANQMDEASKKVSLTNQVAEASKNHRQANQMAEPSRKHPHPDLKYLSQVLTVPKMDDWSEVDDQEWLYGSKDPALKKPEEHSSRDDKEPVVWSEALHLESADIYALPYVIPY